MEREKEREAKRQIMTDGWIGRRERKIEGNRAITMEGWRERERENERGEG